MNRIYLTVLNICIWFPYFLPGFLWQVRPFPGILQAGRNWVAARPQDRGKHIACVSHVGQGSLDSAGASERMTELLLTV